MVMAGLLAESVLYVHQPIGISSRCCRTFVEQTFLDGSTAATIQIIAGITTRCETLSHRCLWITVAQVDQAESYVCICVCLAVLVYPLTANVMLAG